jgi:hypothetical protein
MLVNHRGHELMAIQKSGGKNTNEQKALFDGSALPDCY